MVFAVVDVPDIGFGATVNAAVGAEVGAAVGAPIVRADSLQRLEHDYQRSKFENERSFRKNNSKHSILSEFSRKMKHARRLITSDRPVGAAVGAAIDGTGTGTGTGTCTSTGTGTFTGTGRGTGTRTSAAVGAAVGPVVGVASDTTTTAPLAVPLTGPVVLSDEAIPTGPSSAPVQASH